MSPPSVQTSKSAGWQSRLAAGELVLASMDGKVDFDTAMDASRAFSRLEGADRGFARAMAGAALRGVGRIDWALGGMVQRPLADIEPPLRALLRVGAAQLWMLGVADHAAVSATVEAARQWHEARRGGGLVNAVLRRAAREREAWDKAPATSVWPDWLAAKLKSALGAGRADDMALAQLQEPPVDLTLRAGVDAAIWAERLKAENLARENTKRLRDAMQRQVDEISGREKYINRYKIEWHRKFFLAVVCLVLFFIGAPLGAIIRKGGIGLPTLIALGLFVFYQLLTMAGERMSKNGLLEPWFGIWMSTVVLLPLSLWITFRATKEAALLDRDAYVKTFGKILEFLRLKSKPEVL